MQPLVFLTVRTFVNGIRRALTSPKRLIGLIGVCLYYFYFFMRPWQSPRPMRLPPQFVHPILTMPDLRLLDAILFSVFALLTTFLMASVEQSWAGFKPADVDVLFATPIPPKLILGFRLLRDYLATLILPLFLALVTFRPTSMGVEALIRNFPVHGRYLIRAAIVAWLMLALTWVSLRYAVSLSINRSDLNSDRNKKVLTWTLGTIILFVVATIAAQVPSIHSTQDFVRLANQWPYRVVFFSATLASTMVMAPLRESFSGLFVGASGLIGIIAGALGFALSQSDYMYDQAAIKGYSVRNRIAMMRRGDRAGLLAEQARTGKLRAGKQRWIHRLILQGPGSLLWKEMILQSRGTGVMLVSLSLVVVALGILAALIPIYANPLLSGAVLMAMLGYGVLLVSGTTQTGLMEVLRRVDLQKPLPLTPAAIVFWEVASKVIWTTALLIVSSSVATAIQPRLWPWAAASALYLPTVGLALVSVNFLVLVLFPDIDDPTHRGFRGLMTLLGYVILCSPGLGVLVLLIAFGAHPIIGVLLPTEINIGLATAVTYLAGQFYAAFNPSE